jgi:hypothetical protein
MALALDQWYWLPHQEVNWLLILLIPFSLDIKDYIQPGKLCQYTNDHGIFQLQNKEVFSQFTSLLDLSLCLSLLSLFQS